MHNEEVKESEQFLLAALVYTKNLAFRVRNAICGQ